MEIRPSQYEAALRFIKSADEALRHATASIKRREESSRIRRGIEEVESFLKKVKQELRIS
jgi:hypothetical protein